MLQQSAKQLLAKYASMFLVMVLFFAVVVVVINNQHQSTAEQSKGTAKTSAAQEKEATTESLGVIGKVRISIEIQTRETEKHPQRLCVIYPESPDYFSQGQLMRLIGQYAQSQNLRIVSHAYVHSSMTVVFERLP